MRAQVGVALAGLCAVMSASSASAQRVSVVVEGECVERVDVESALALELAAGWVMVGEDDSTAEVRVEVVAAACEAATWTARVVDRSGVVVRGPAELAMAGFAPASRARIAALWLAEWLATLPGAPEAEADPAPVSVPEPAPVSVPDVEPGADSGSDADSDPGPDPDSDDPPLRFRFVALATFRQVPDTPATLGGGEIGVQLARGDELGFGVELSAGVEGGVQWTYEMLVLRGSVSAFALLAPAAWVEIDLGARASLEHLTEYTRSALRERLYGPLHGTVGAFARTLLFVTGGLAVAVDLELGGALAPVVYSVEQPPGYELPSDWDELLGGFYFAARAGIVVQ